MDFSVNIENQGDKVLISVAGAIDENSDFPPVQLSGVSEVVFDLENVKYINSVGIKMWIQWISALSQIGKIDFVNCPKAIVQQMNMVKGFLPSGANVSSFYVPLFCEDCDVEDVMLVNQSDVDISDEPELKAKLKICEECPEEMELDAIPKKYFRFLKGDVG